MIFGPGKGGNRPGFKHERHSPFSVGAGHFTAADGDGRARLGVSLHPPGFHAQSVRFVTGHRPAMESFPGDLDWAGIRRRQNHHEFFYIGGTDRRRDRDPGLIAQGHGSVNAGLWISKIRSPARGLKRLDRDAAGSCQGDGTHRLR